MCVQALVGSDFLVCAHISLCVVDRFRVSNCIGHQPEHQTDICSWRNGGIAEECKIMSVKEMELLYNSVSLSFLSGIRSEVDEAAAKEDGSP